MSVGNERAFIREKNCRDRTKSRMSVCKCIITHHAPVPFHVIAVETRTARLGMVSVRERILERALLRFEDIQTQMLKDSFHQKRSDLSTTISELS